MSPATRAVLTMASLSVFGCTARRADNHRLERWDVDVDPATMLERKATTLHAGPYGTMWIGTAGGGALRYGHEEDDVHAFTMQEGLCDSHVTAIMAEQSGAVWFAGENGCVCRRDPDTGAFRTFGHELPNQDFLRARAVRGILEGRDGAVWLGAAEVGLIRYDPTADAFSHLPIEGFYRDNIDFLYQDSGGALWMTGGFSPGGVKRLDPRTGLLIGLFDTEDSYVGVTSVQEERGSGFWFGTSRGALHFDVATGEVAGLTEADGLADSSVLAIHQDDSGVLWFGTPKGVTRYDPPTRAIRTFTRDDGLAGNRITAVAQRADGTMWFATDGGVSIHDPRDGSFRSVPVAEGIPRRINTIAQEKGGAIWFGTHRGAIRVDRAEGSVKSFTESNGLVSDDVKVIAAESVGTMLFGTNGGVSRYDPKSASWSDIEDLRGASVTTLRPQPDGEEVWIALDSWRHEQMRIFRYEPATKTRLGFTKAADLDVQVNAIVVEKDESVWLAAGRYGMEQIVHYDPIRDRMHRYREHDDLRGNRGGPALADTFGGSRDEDVLAIAKGPDGLLWFGGERGAGSLDPRTDEIMQIRSMDSAHINVIHVEPTGVVWFGTRSSGLLRYDPKKKEALEVRMRHQERVDEVHAIHQEADGTLWFGGDTGVLRILPDATGEQTGLLTRAFDDAGQRTLAVNGTSLAVSRPAGLCLVQLSSPSPSSSRVTTLPSSEAGAQTVALAPGPSGSFWVGTELSGLALRAPSRSDLRVSTRGGLPHASITGLSPLPGSNGKQVWVATRAGAARVALVDGDHGNTAQLRVERTVTSANGIPQGPVDAIASHPDGSAFLVFNAVASARTSDPSWAQRRPRTIILRTRADGGLDPEIEIPKGVIRAIEFANDTLWVGTSVGLSAVERPARQGAAALQILGLPPAPIRSLVVDPTGTVWMGTDAQKGIQPFVMGYSPSSRLSFSFMQEDGVPDGEAVNAIGVTDDGEMVILVGAALVKGKIFIPAPKMPWTTLSAALALLLLGGFTLWSSIFRNHHVVRFRASPAALRDVALGALPEVLLRLRRARVLDEVAREMDLPPRRLGVVNDLLAESSERRLRAVAAVLGVERIDLHRPEDRGVLLANIDLPGVRPLQGQSIPIVALHDEETEAGAAQEAIRRVLTDFGHRAEYPFLFLSRDPERGRAMLPAEMRALVMSEDVERELLFARSPERALAGMLHTRGLLIVSPYKDAGEVKDPTMFYGRHQLLRELFTAASFQYILVGARRVGKTSLLRRFEHAVSTRRADTHVVFIDLIGVSDYARTCRVLAKRLGVEPAPVRGVDDAILAFSSMIQGHLERTARKIILLIDEADGLIDTDARCGFPFLSMLRRLQSEGLCSFIVAGYWHLYRRTLDHASPLYNFAPVRILGPLEQDAARRLAIGPMERIGIRYASEEVVDRILEQTGCYPQLIQLLCDQLVRELGGADSLVLSGAHLARAEESQRVRDLLAVSFHSNTAAAGKLLAYCMIECQRFSLGEAHAALSSAVGRSCPLRDVDGLLKQLVLFGILAATADRYGWRIPLLRQMLLQDDPVARQKQLVDELTSDAADWVDTGPEAEGAGEPCA